MAKKTSADGPQTFNVGDVVQLKSGGPKMTVTIARKEYSGEVGTTWFAGRKNEHGSFPPEALVVAAEGEAEQEQ